MAPITHIVIMQFKSDTDEAQKKALGEAFLALRNQCLSPDNFTSPGAPYILNIIGGSNNSSEAPAKGYEVSRHTNSIAIILLNIRSVRHVQHAYIVTLASEQHREYYLNHDPAHKAFELSFGSLIEKEVVTDFIDGVWN